MLQWISEFQYIQVYIFAISTPTPLSVIQGRLLVRIWVRKCTANKEARIFDTHSWVYLAYANYMFLSFDVPLHLAIYFKIGILWGARNTHDVIGALVWRPKASWWYGSRRANKSKQTVLSRVLWPYIKKSLDLSSEFCNFTSNCREQQVDAEGGNTQMKGTHVEQLRNIPVSISCNRSDWRTTCV